MRRLNWSDFLNTGNPVASALMARMKIHPRDRPRVKLQCLRLLATLRLDPSKSALLSRFVDSYLRLNAREVRIFEESLESLPQGERQVIMQITTSWKEEGRREGRLEGQEQGLREGLKAALKRVFGPPAADLIDRLAGFSLSALEQLQKQLVAGAELAQLESLGR